MADLDDIERRLSTANVLNGVNLAVNVDAAVSARRMANALEEQNQRARIAEERQARIGALRNALFESEKILDEIRDSLASHSARKVLIVGDAVMGVVRTLEVQIFLNQDGALDPMAFDLLEDKRFAECVRRKIQTQLDSIERLYPGTLAMVETWNVSEEVCAHIQALLLYDRLLNKPLAPDMPEKRRRLAKLGGGMVALVLLAKSFAGVGVTMVVFAICLGGMLWLVRRPAPLSHGQRARINQRWHGLLPGGLLTTNKLTKYRGEIVAKLAAFNVDSENAEARLAAFNDSRQNAIESGAIPLRPNSCVLRPYTGRFITPEI